MQTNSTSGKRILTQLTHTTDIGYELTPGLLVRRRQWQPFRAVGMHLKTAGGVMGTGIQRCRSARRSSCRRWRRAAWELDKSLLHVIDRERVSVDCFRKSNHRVQLPREPMIAACSGPVSLFS